MISTVDILHHSLQVSTCIYLEASNVFDLLFGFGTFNMQMNHLVHLKMQVIDLVGLTELGTVFPAMIWALLVHGLIFGSTASQCIDGL